MAIYTPALICLLAFAAYGSAGLFGGGGFNRLPFNIEMKPVNASSIWVNKPVDGSYPSFVPITEEHGEGETLLDLCIYVAANKALPWPLPEDKEKSDAKHYYHRAFPSLERIQKFCDDVIQNGGIFYAPESKRFDEPSSSNGFSKRDTRAEKNGDKTPGF